MQNNWNSVITGKQRVNQHPLINVRYPKPRDAYLMIKNYFPFEIITCNQNSQVKILITTFLNVPTQIRVPLVFNNDPESK